MEDDPLYLKKYVNQHPDNKMAWYLLGRQYRDRGETGKAAYCFAQAGEVFEAFEQKVLVMPEENRAGSREGRRTFGRWLRRAAAMLAGLLLLVLLAVPTGPTPPDGAPADGRRPASGPDRGASASPAGPGDKPIRIVYAWDSEPERTRAALQELLFPSRSGSATTLLVQGSSSGDSGWINWLREPVYRLAAHREQGSGRLEIEYYDPDLCVCEPGDSARMRAYFPEWQMIQEQLAVMKSAIEAYTRLNGSPPSDWSVMNQTYPGNMLPGFTGEMRDAFQVWLEQASSGDTRASRGADRPGAGGEDADAPGESAVAWAWLDASGLWTEPLEIIVDKQNHRLALVSGSLILRNYPVGLGGSKTPEGGFTVTEKVRDPNGRSDGEFGSRGMTLSDTLYAIHGTNDPSSIGTDRSLGCVRMLREDLEELFDMTPLGTRVTIRTGVLPDEIIRPEKAFRLPAEAVETNPDKVYRWLN